jgi:hypothetical protein
MAAFVAEAIGIPIKPAGRAAAVDTNVEAAPSSSRARMPGRTPRTQNE